MPTKSTNTQGNPYHDEEGKFTSPDGVGGLTPEQQKEREMHSVPNQPNPQINTQPNIAPSKFSKFKLKANVEQIRNELQKSNRVASIPFLSSARDIEEHLDDYFTEEIVKNIDSKFGKFKVPYKYFNLRTDPDQRCGVNIFAACIGKKRWTNNYLRLIDAGEYARLRQSYGMSSIWRGIEAPNYETFRLIADSYSSKENEMIYGSVGGTAYGIAVYASNYRDEAWQYARRKDNHIMDLILNKNTKTMNYNSICSIRNDISYIKNRLVDRVEKIFLKNGIEPTRANDMARSFGITLNDEGFIAILLGVEWYQAGSYHMVENLGAMYRYIHN